MEKLTKIEIEAIERWKQLSENKQLTQCPFILVYNKLNCRRCRKLIGTSQYLVCPCLELGIDAVAELANKLLTFSKIEQVKENKNDPRN